MTACIKVCSLKHPHSRIKYLNSTHSLAVRQHISVLTMDGEILSITLSPTGWRGNCGSRIRNISVYQIQRSRGPPLHLIKKDRARFTDVGVPGQLKWPLSVSINSAYIVTYTWLKMMPPLFRPMQVTDSWLVSSDDYLDAFHHKRTWILWKPLFCGGPRMTLKSGPDKEGFNIPNVSFEGNYKP